MFHMYDKKIYKCDVTCSFNTPPCHTFSDPLERDILYGWPLSGLGFLYTCIWVFQQWTRASVLKSLYWLKISEQIEYKVTSLTYKTLQSKKHFSKICK